MANKKCHNMDIYQYLYENLFSVETLCAVVALWSKINLFNEKESGFTLGIIAAVSGAIFAFQLGLSIYFVIEVSAAIHCILGKINNKRKKLGKEITYRRVLKSITIIACAIVLCIKLYNDSLSINSLLELLGAALGIWAFENLALHKFLKGWILLLFTHIVYNYFMVLDGKWIMFTLQGISLFIALCAIWKLTKKK